MRAVMCRSYGPPEVAVIEDVERPEPGPDEILVRVVASSVNRTDCAIRSATPWFARAVYGLRRPRRPILGSTFAGVVEAAGPAVERFAAGDRVFGFDDTGLGGHAEYLVRPGDGMVAPIPGGISFAEAGVATEGAHYAGTVLRAVGVDRGDRVLVYGASGAVGSAAVQLAGHLGAEVTAVCGTEALEVVGSLGPNRLIDYRRQDFTRLGATHDLVFDAVGKSSFAACRPLLGPSGVYVSTELGRGAQNAVLALLGRLPVGPRVRFPLPRTGWESMSFVLDAIEAGAYRPVLDRSYQLDEIVEAYRYVESARKVGNVTLAIGRDGEPDRPAEA